MPDSQLFHTSNPQSPAGFRPLRSFARLVLGGVLEGRGILRRSLRQWEQAPDALVSHPEPALSVALTPSQADGSDFDPLPQELPPPAIDQPPLKPSHVAPAAVLGLALTSLDRLSQASTVTTRIRRRQEQRLVRLVGRLPFAMVLAPWKDRFDRLVVRGEQQVTAWAARGRAEAFRSRQLAQQAVQSTTAVMITSLTQNPEVKDLVQSHSVGLAAEVVEEVRERTVSADTFLEDLARSVLRRMPRQELPPPPPEVRQRAERLHQPENYQ